MIKAREMLGVAKIYIPMTNREVNVTIKINYYNKNNLNSDIYIDCWTYLNTKKTL